MFPFPAVLVGVSDELALTVRQELSNVAATVEAEYRGADTAFEGMRAAPSVKKLFIVLFETPADAKCIVRLVETQCGSPILALVDVANDSQNLLHANRAGAMQVIPLPLQPADLHRALSCVAVQYRQPSDDCPIIAFTGSAPGCGATTLATNTAYEMATLHRQHTVLIELSQQRGVLATNLDVQPTYTLTDLLADPDQIDVQLMQRSLVRVADNFDILAGSRDMGTPGAFAMSGVHRVLDYVKSLARYIVLDVPCTNDEFQFEALGNARQIVLVGEQSISSIRTLKLLLDTLRSGPGQHTFQVVVNRYDAKMDGLSVGNLEKVLGMSMIRTLADDRPGVLGAANEGKLLRQFNPNSAVLAGIDDLVGALLGLSDRPAPSGLVRRFFSVFKS